MNKNKYFLNVLKLKKIIGESNSKTWILTGSTVIYLYSTFLSETIIPYREPADIDLYCTKKFFNKILQDNNVKNKKVTSFTKIFPVIGQVDFYLCENKETFKRAINFKDYFYCASIEDMLEFKKYELNNTIINFIKIRQDFNALTKIIVIEKTINLKESPKTMNLAVKILEA